MSDASTAAATSSTAAPAASAARRAAARPRCSCRRPAPARSRRRRRRRCRRRQSPRPRASTPISRCRGSEPMASRMPNSRVRALTENASTPATPTTAISSATAGEAAEDERVQAVRRQHFGAHVLERRRLLHRLVGRQLADDARDRRHQRVRIAAACARTGGRRRTPARAGGTRSSPARARRSRRRRRRRRRRCGAARCSTPMNLHHRVGPHEAAVDRVLAREHPLAPGSG